MLTPNEAYQYDPTFRRVVDLMCAYLSEYEITPAELRQAAILAATMHADRCIKPLYIAKPKPWEGYNCICSTPYWGQAHSSTCRDYNWDVTHSKPEHCHIFRASGHGYDVCNDCGMSDVYYNWSTRKPSFCEWAYNILRRKSWLQS